MSPCKASRVSRRRHGTRGLSAIAAAALSTAFTPTPLGSAEAAACVINGTPVTTIATQAECDALVALYTSTDGPNWDTNTGWTTPDRPVHLARRHL